MAFFNASMPPQATMMDTSDMFYFRHIYSTTSTMWYDPDSFSLCRLVYPFFSLACCTRPILCGSCGSLLQLWVIILPIHTCMIRHWLLLWCLLWSPGRSMHGFPRLYESGGSMWQCLGFLWIISGYEGYLCLSLSILWFLWFWEDAVRWGIWRQYLLCEGELSVAGPPF